MVATLFAFHWVSQRLYAF